MDPFNVNAKPTELRRSCVFCRQRKMRCSGDLPCCTICRQREKPCVYEPVAFKGRYAALAASKNARSMPIMATNKSSNTATLSSSNISTSSTIVGVGVGGNEVDPIYASADDQMKSFQDYVSLNASSSTSRFDQNSRLDYNSLPSPSHPFPTSNNIEGNLVGDELTFLFGTFFAMTQQSALIHNANQRNEVGSNPTNGTDPMCAHSISIPLTYVDALPILTYDLVRLTINRLNNVNLVNNTGDYSALPYVHSLIMDRSMTVIDGLDNPEAEQWFTIHGPPSGNQVEQLLEMAFINHPLANLIVPKTPFIREHHEGHSNFCLLWLLCSEGIELGFPTIGIKPNTPLAFNLPSSASFLQLAWKQLFNARQNVPSDRFWISQALLLLGFRLLCHSHVKQATAFLLLCVRCITRVVTDRSRNPALEVKINGVRMTEVEEQAVNNVFWISHGLLLWIWSQVDRSDVDLARFICPDPPVLLTAITAAKIPSTSLCADAIYRLDYVSAQFTSLNMQCTNARTLTILAHVCNMVHTLINYAGAATIGGGMAESNTFFSFPNQNNTLAGQTFSNFADQNENIGQTVLKEQGNASSDDFSSGTGSTMYAAISARLLHQTKQTLSAVSNSHLADKYAEKSILCTAYLFSICLCEPSSNMSETWTNSISQRKELAHRFRSAIDIAAGMVRDCKDRQPIYHQLAPPKECALIRRLFGHASKVLYRIYSYVQQVQEMINSEAGMRNQTDHQSDNLFDTGLSSQEIAVTLNAVDVCAERNQEHIDGPLFDMYFRSDSQVNAAMNINPLDDIAAIARSLISPKAINNNQMTVLSDSQKISSDSSIVGSDHSNRFHDIQRKGSVAGTTVSNEESRSIDANQMQVQQETQRARSFSDSAAIYSSTSQMPHFPPHNMSFVQQSPTYSSFFQTMPPPSTSGYTSFTSAMNAAANATASVTGSAGGEIPASTSSSSSTNHRNVTSMAADHLGTGVSSIALRRSRTYSINDVRSEGSFPSPLTSSINGTGHFPPSPPQSAPPSHLALLSDTSATLQAMLHDYNVSTTNNNGSSSSGSGGSGSGSSHNAMNSNDQQEHLYSHSHLNESNHQHLVPHHRFHHHDIVGPMVGHNEDENSAVGNGNNESINALRTASWAATTGGTTTIHSLTPIVANYHQDVKLHLH